MEKKFLSQTISFKGENMEDAIDALFESIIETMMRTDSKFKKYWLSLSKLDKKEIMEDVKDSIYDWKIAQGSLRDIEL